jgi:hypothetical protein
MCWLAMARPTIARGLSSAGGGVTWERDPELMGGHLDFGIVLFERGLYVQNHFLLRGGGLRIKGKNHSVFTLSEKVLFGRRLEETGLYTYIEGGIGVYGHESKNFFEGPAVYSFGFGGGFEITTRHFGGIYGEVGYLGQRVSEGYPVGGVILQTGVRVHF